MVRTVFAILFFPVSYSVFLFLVFSFSYILFFFSFYHILFYLLFFLLLLHFLSHFLIPFSLLLSPYPVIHYSRYPIPFLFFHGLFSLQLSRTSIRCLILLDEDEDILLLLFSFFFSLLSYFLFTILFTPFPYLFSYFVFSFLILFSMLFAILFNRFTILIPIAIEEQFGEQIYQIFPTSKLKSIYIGITIIQIHIKNII